MELARAFPNIAQQVCFHPKQSTFNSLVRQLRDPVAGDNIGMALTEALHHAIETELDREQRPAHHFVNFAITAHGFAHAYQTANFTVGEFLQRTARLDEMLATLAGKLNSRSRFLSGCRVCVHARPGIRSWKKIQPWTSMPGSRKQEKTMHRHHQKQRCLMLCSRHRDHASALPQRSKRGRVSRVGKFKAWASGAATTSPGTASAGRGGRGSLWHRGIAPTSTGVGAPKSIAGDDPDETVLFDFQRTHCPSSDSFTEIQSSF